MYIRFVVPGKPRGYVATTYKSKFKRGFDAAAYKSYLRYAAYCKHVRRCARAAGVELPIVSGPQNPLLIKTIAYFKNGVHADPENIRKGIADALCYNEKGAKNSRKGKDKWIGGSFPPPRYDPDNPRVIVIIKSYEPPKHVAPDMTLPSKRKKKRKKKKCPS